MKNQFLAALVQLLKDKNGNHSLREVATAIFVLVLLVSWVAEQFFDKQMPEYMFYAFVSLVGAGCFGYSIERKTTINDKN
jgi:NADH:ubiquinone oxidoreductase subunit 4 (subunit M)